MNPKKICRICAEEKSLDDYHRNKDSRDGKSPYCKPCAKAKAKAWAQANPERRRQSQSRFATKNPERVRVYQRAYVERHKERVLANSRKYRERNLEEVRRRANEAAQRRHHELQKSSVGYVLNNRIRALMSRAIKQGKNGRSCWELVGYTADELAEHIERQFTEGMTWDRLKAGDIHIDHIVPLSSFTFTGPDDPALKSAWCLSNLRPLWADENRQKSNRALYLV